MVENTPWNLIKIKNTARFLQNKYGQNRPTVSVEKIVNGENIFIKYHSVSEAGFPIAVKKGNRYGILICSLFEEEVVRWHTACALGGIVLGYLNDRADSLTEDKISEQSRIQLEEEMDTFAGELLIPEIWAKSFLTKGYSLNALIDAQALCKVPMDKLVRRLHLLEASINPSISQRKKTANYHSLAKTLPEYPQF